MVLVNGYNEAKQIIPAKKKKDKNKKEVFEI
jgi:hypothetical protein